MLHLRNPKLWRLTYICKQHNTTDSGNINGTVVLNTPGSKMFVSGNYVPGSMAYTSCDPNDYDGDINMNKVISQAIAADVPAILFYTTNSSFCNVTQLDQYHDYMYMYSMVNSSDASMLFSQITNGPNYGNLFSSTAYNNTIQQQIDSSPLGGSGSTAVAMIILYSITGVITALFLVIIVTGAVRAHRHPERYGPRNIMGRPRQSRAKGIARAMLDTLPIVKFGEKVEGKDIEQQGINDATTQSTELSNRNPSSTNEAHQTAERATETSAVDATGAHISGPNDARGESPNSSQHDAAATTTAASAQPEEENQGCSICTDDFEKGQDIRVLPCNHQFHPACVDPWLLDVSGTCPLCRVDLNPSTDTAGDDLPPPLDETQATPLSPRDRRRAMLRGMMMRGSNNTESAGEGLQSANQEHRMAALRQWRQNRLSRPAEASQPASSASDSADTAASEEQQDDSHRRSRLSALSRLVRRR